MLTSLSIHQFALIERPVIVAAHVVDSEQVARRIANGYLSAADFVDLYLARRDLADCTDPRECQVVTPSRYWGAEAPSLM